MIWRRSNCHLAAWERFRAGEAVFMCVRFTSYSKVPQRVIEHWLWRYTLGVAGATIQWIAWPLTHLGEILRTGRWYHATWVAVSGEHLEYVPRETKKRRWFPPLLFFGVERRVPPKHGEKTHDDGARP